MRVKKLEVFEISVNEGEGTEKSPIRNVNYYIDSEARLLFVDRFDAARKGVAINEKLDREADFIAFKKCNCWEGYVCDYCKNDIKKELAEFMSDILALMEINKIDEGLFKKMSRLCEAHMTELNKLL
jgi:hypothetical protein